MFKVDNFSDEWNIFASVRWNECFYLFYWNENAFFNFRENTKFPECLFSDPVFATIFAKSCALVLLIFLLKLCENQIFLAKLFAKKIFSRMVPILHVADKFFAFL